MKKTRSDLFLHDMIHNNPGLAIYDSEYRSVHFLKERRYDAKVFDLYDCAQYGLLWDRLSEHNHKPPVFPEGSASRKLGTREESSTASGLQGRKSIWTTCLLYDGCDCPARGSKAAIPRDRKPRRKDRYLRTCYGADFRLHV